MSDVHNTTAATAAHEPTVAEPAAVITAPAEELPTIAEPAAEPVAPVIEEPKAEAVAPVEELTAEAPASEKTVEPVTEGQLAYKGPGLVKSLIATKKEFWLDDSAVTSQNLHSFLRGEKPEVSHPVAAWASQTGRGLLFINKKGDTNRTSPADVLALYDATDLKKETPHSFAFRLNGHNHTFKAANDAERDAWYISIEKAIELGKASKEEVIASEGYKAELEKLGKPHTSAAAGVAAAKRGQSQPKKSTELDNAGPARVGSDAEEDTTKKQKSRSTSRGILNRFKGKAEETEHKVVEKKEVKEEKKAEEEGAPVAEVAPVVAATEAPVIASSEDKPVEPVADAAEEKPRPTKRGSIFGKVSSGWGSFKSPTKEKSEKEAELKPDVPPKDGVVSENPPVLPETATATEPAVESAVLAVPAVEEPVSTTEPTTETAPAMTEAVSPSTQKKNFLSGFGGFSKRGRSVSPSANLKEPTAKKEEPAVAAPVAESSEPAASAPIESVTETPAVTEPAVAESAEKPVEESETTTPNKRQSVFGTLGRRASKAFRGLQSPRKENAAPAATESTAEEGATAAKPVDETAPVVNGESKVHEPDAQHSIGDVVPEAVNVGSPQHTTPVVTATA